MITQNLEHSLHISVNFMLLFQICYLFLLLMNKKRLIFIIFYKKTNHILMENIMNIKIILKALYFILFSLLLEIMTSFLINLSKFHQAHEQKHLEMLVLVEIIFIFHKMMIYYQYQTSLQFFKKDFPP
jgi:hypothetical protein